MKLRRSVKSKYTHSLCMCSILSIFPHLHMTRYFHCFDILKCERLDKLVVQCIYIFITPQLFRDMYYYIYIYINIFSNQ